MEKEIAETGFYVLNSKIIFCSFCINYNQSWELALGKGYIYSQRGKSLVHTQKFTQTIVWGEKNVTKHQTINSI